MGGYNFSRKQCIRALIRLGFILKNKRSGRHDKFEPPSSILNKLSGNQPKFIMAPRHNELHCQNEIITELRAMGGDALLKQFTNNL